MSAALWAGVAVFGGLGAVARLLMEHGVRRQLTMAFPVGTITVNVTGAFLLGVVSGIGLSHIGAVLIGTGFLGAYTTFSGWMLETRSLRQDRRMRAAAANIAVSVVLGLLAAWAGQRLGLVLKN
ncbi:MAG: fluoride efflux transporter CrcB [Mycobacterium sp.]|nr:fluoride efflux transporter CrcB [Mycobacterium sp.]